MLSSAPADASEKGTTTARTDPTGTVVTEWKLSKHGNLIGPGGKAFAIERSACIDSGVRVNQTPHSTDELTTIHISLINETRDSRECPKGLTLEFSRILKQEAQTGLGYGDEALNRVLPIWIESNQLTNNAPPEGLKQPQNFWGVQNRYYAFLLESDDPFQISFDEEAPDVSAFRITTSNFQIPAGGTKTFVFRIHANSKKSLALQERFANIKYLGYWGFLQTFFGLFEVLIFWLFQIFQTWPGALFALAIIIRMALWPITRWAERVQAKVLADQARIQPLIDKIKSEVKGSAEQSEKILAVYKEHGISPFSGMKAVLPLLLQLPILIALYAIIVGEVTLQETSWLWIEDLSQPDRLFSWHVNIPLLGSYFNLLPILMGFFSIVATALASNAASESKANLRSQFLMNGSFVVLFYTFPSAVLLYWVFANMIQATTGIFKRLYKKTRLPSESPSHA